MYPPVTQLDSRWRELFELLFGKEDSLVRESENEEGGGDEPAALAMPLVRRGPEAAHGAA